MVQSSCIKSSRIRWWSSRLNSIDEPLEYWSASAKCMGGCKGDWPIASWRIRSSNWNSRCPTNLYLKSTLVGCSGYTAWKATIWGRYCIRSRIWEFYPGRIVESWRTGTLWDDDNTSWRRHVPIWNAVNAGSPAVASALYEKRNFYPRTSHGRGCIYRLRQISWHCQYHQTKQGTEIINCFHTVLISFDYYTDKPLLKHWPFQTGRFHGSSF